MCNIKPVREKDYSFAQLRQAMFTGNLDPFPMSTDLSFRLAQAVSDMRILFGDTAPMWGARVTLYSDFHFGVVMMPQNVLTL